MIKRLENLSLKQVLMAYIHRYIRFAITIQWISFIDTFQYPIWSVHKLSRTLFEYRLTPAYAFLILCVVGFIGKVGDGPRWPEAYSEMHTSCKAYWWTNLLYVNNLYPAALLDEVCRLSGFLNKSSNKLDYISVLRTRMVSCQWYAILYTCTNIPHFTEVVRYIEFPAVDTRSMVLHASKLSNEIA